MDEEYPDQGIEGQDQDLDPERAGQLPRRTAGRSAAAAEPAANGRRPGGRGHGRAEPPAGAPAEEHVAVLEEVHGRLRDILGELNEGTP